MSKPEIFLADGTAAVGVAPQLESFNLFARYQQLVELMRQSNYRWGRPLMGAYKKDDEKKDKDNRQWEILQLTDPFELTKRGKPQNFSAVVKLKLKDGTNYVVLKAVKAHSKWTDENPNSCYEICFLFELQRFVLGGMCRNFPLLINFQLPRGKISSPEPRLQSIFPQFSGPHWDLIAYPVGFYVSEYADFGSFLDWIAKNFQTDVGDMLLGIIFQVVYALAFLQFWYPGFRHNDLHIKNVYLSWEPHVENGFHEYIFPPNEHFYIPAGIRAMISDFQLTTHLGAPDNAAICPAMNDTDGLSATPSPYYDLHVFMNSVYSALYDIIDKDRMWAHPRFNTLKNNIMKMYGRDYLSDANNQPSNLVRSRLKSDLKFPDGFPTASGLLHEWAPFKHFKSNFILKDIPVHDRHIISLNQFFVPME